MTSPDLEATLKERGSRYGEFKDNAAIAQNMKTLLSLNPGWHPMHADQREAIEMICVKISRILTGNPDYVDNWVDIAGYAQLVANRLSKS